VFQKKAYHVHRLREKFTSKNRTGLISNSSYGVDSKNKGLHIEKFKMYNWRWAVSRASTCTKVVMGKQQLSEGAMAAQAPTTSSIITADLETWKLDHGA